MMLNAFEALNIHQVNIFKIWIGRGLTLIKVISSGRQRQRVNIENKLKYKRMIK